MNVMQLTLHSLSVYEEIVAHNDLKMMTQLTDFVVSSHASDLFWAKNRSEAYRNAWIGATEATLVERKQSELLSSALV